MGFSENLKATREAKSHHYKDVPVILDGELAQKRERLLKALEEQPEDDRLGAETAADQIREELEALTDAAQGSIVTLRFRRLPGRDWAALTSKHPVRPDVPIDRHYGYNYDAVCEAAAAYRDADGTWYGVRLEDGEEIPLIIRPATENEPAVNEWTDLFDVLSGAEIGDIRDAVWSLNEFEPQQRLEMLVKGSGAATRSETI